MSLDSTANLLFNIGANSDDAEANIQRFRTLMGKSLDDMASEFEEWATEIVGEIGTVQAAMTAGVAIIAAAGVAAVGVMKEAADTYIELVSEVGKASKMTGIAVEEMSAMHAAAKATGTNFEALTHGILLFESAVKKANQGSAEQAKLFKELGITQAQLADGEQHIAPLIELTMDRMKGLASGTERAAMSREAFGRSGTEMLGFLTLGSEGLKHFGEMAREAGLIVTNQDVPAVKQYKLVLMELKEMWEGLAVELGRTVLPALKYLGEFVFASLKAIQTARTWKDELASTLTLGMSDVIKYSQIAGTEMYHLDEEINKVVADMGKVGDKKLPPPTEVAAVTEQFSALSSELEHVNEKMASSQGEYEKTTAEITHLSVELMKARAEFGKLRAEGKLSAEDAQRESSALNALPAAILNLWTDLREKLAVKRREADEKEKDAAVAATSDLLKRIQDQHEKTIASQEIDWTDEMAKLTASYQKKGQLTEQNEKLIADLKEQGLFKIHRDQLTAYSQELLDLQQHLASLFEANMNAAEKLKMEQAMEVDQLRRTQMEKLKTVQEGTYAWKAMTELQKTEMETLTANQGKSLQALLNSQGWQGVFGSKFAELIKGNESLSRQWAQSAHQDLLMVQVAMESLHQTGQQMFTGMAEGMGAGIANAFVYKKSIVDAMEEAAKSELESVASRSLVNAIYSTGLGFMDLAIGNEAGAASAFEAAAVFGTVAAAAGIAGRAIPSSQSGAGSGAGSGPNGQAAAFGADSQNVPAPQGQRGPNITINVQGHIVGPSGISELTGMINDAVLNQDVTLTATNTRTGVQVTR